jgi:hypothetical protein
VATLGASIALAGALQAQHVVSVPFTDGFIGTRASSPGNANDVLTYATLGIARTFFIQNSSTTQFEVKSTPQGNDIRGTLRIVRTDGTTLDIPAIANWRDGSPTHLIGILPKPTSPITLSYGGGSIQITDGEVPNTGTSVGGYVAAYGGAKLADGGSVSGNAAQSQLLSGLNTYLATVVSSRPAGPVTVSTLTTSSTTPTLTGTATLAAGEQLAVVVGGVEYTTASTPAVARSGTNWSLALASPLAVGTHEVTATVTNASGFTLSDATTNELTVTAPLRPVTLGGSFTANGRTYDGTTAATGTTSGLTLVGVNGGDQVTIAGVTLAFQSAAAGVGRTVVVTGVTLGGTHAAQYAPDLTGAPTATATIAPKALTITGVAAAGRVYDGTTAAALTGTPSYVGLAGSESFAVAGTPAASFASAAVGAGKPVTVTGYAPPNANYTVAQPTGLTASVTARPLAIGGTFTVADKVFDGTTAATIAGDALTLVGVVGTDAVALAGVTAAFADAAVGAAKPVSITAASLTGAAASNYTVGVAGAPTTTASITAVPVVPTPPVIPVPPVIPTPPVTPTPPVVPVVPVVPVPTGGTLTLGGSFTAADRTYDGTTAATGTTTGLTLVGVSGGDQVAITGVTLAFASPAAGAARPVAITAVTLGGADAARYTVSLVGAPTATATIAPRPVALGGTFTAADKLYDGMTIATVATRALTAVGVVGGETLAVGDVAAAFASPAVGAGRPVALTSATLVGPTAANYVLSLAGAPTTTAGILPRPVTIGGSFTAADKVHDGTPTATVATSALRLLGVLGGHDVALAGVTAAFADAAVGSAKPVAIRTASLAGAAAGSYVLSLADAPTATASILAATPPSAPRQVTATPGDRSVTVSWAAPESAGCRAVTGYLVEVSTDGGRGWTAGATAGPTASSAVVSGLVNNVAHQLRVAAVNACGTGAPAGAPAPVVPIAPVRDGAGRVAPSAPGTAAVTTAGAPQAATLEVVQDTMVRLTAGDFALRLRATDAPGAPVPVDSSRTLQLEHGGRAVADGSGFAAGTYVTVYLGAPAAEPVLLGTAAVRPDAGFATTLPIPADLPAGPYTLQVNGVDRVRAPRTVSVGVEVVPPPPDLELTATPDQRSPALGDTITITLTVTNVGRGPAIDVAIPRAFTEPGFAVVRTTPLEGAYQAATQTWTIRRIEPGARARMLLTAIVVPRTAVAATAPTTAPSAAPGATP